MFIRSIRTVAGAITISMIAGSALVGAPVQGAALEVETLPVMQVLGAARPPVGHVEFCAGMPQECAAMPGRAMRIVLTSVSLAELDRMNRYVNARIAPVTDAELFGVAEKWSYPIDRGDCEDYVILKRRMLIDGGWPPSALLITVVRDEKGDGHAVLTVATDKGDLVLDNQRDEILPWQRTGYQYVKRQSQADPSAWVFVGTGPAAPGVASAR